MSSSKALAIALSIVFALGIAQVDALGNGINGWSARVVADGFYEQNSVGPIGIAFHPDDNSLWVMSYWPKNLYRFPYSDVLSGAALHTMDTATPNSAYFVVKVDTAQRAPGFMAGMRWFKLTDSSPPTLFISGQSSGNIGLWSIDTSTGVVTQRASNPNSCSSGGLDLEINPKDNKLYQSGSTIVRMDFDTSTGMATCSRYISDNCDGISFDFTGNLYCADSSVLRSAPYSASTTSFTNSFYHTSDSPANEHVGGVDGLASDLDRTFVLTNTNSGHIVKAFLNGTSSVVYHGGTRGDFATVGPDGCFYFTQTFDVGRLGLADGSCPKLVSATPVDTCPGCSAVTVAASCSSTASASTTTGHCVSLKFDNSLPC